VVTGYGSVEGRSRNEAALIARHHVVGSGVIVDADGYIMTNAHVVEGAQRIHVALPAPEANSSAQFEAGAGRVLEAKLVGIHQESDLALLKIDKTNLPALVLGRTRPVHQGELVFALGSPEGLQNSVTMGVVSSVGRQADPSRPLLYIQTDAPINPGNSGGPLVDTEGYVIGLNTFILSQGGGSEGLGFAIPARVVDFVYHSLRKYGHVHRVEVKAGAQTITPTLAQGLGLAQSWGVVVDDVTPGGPADSAGLRVQDIILTADDRPINDLPAFTASLYLHPLDQVLKLEVMRGEDKLTLNVPVLEMTEPMDAITSLANSQNNLVGRLGILALDLDDQLRSMVGELRISSGVVVVGRAAEFNSADSGLQAGDVIHCLNRTAIDSVATLRTAVRALKPGDAVVLQIERGGGLLYLSFDME
jgi:serine protease Do